MRQGDLFPHRPAGAATSRGTARINSGLGEGTTITIWLPRAEAITVPREDPVVSPAGRGAALKILLVDDDQAVRALTEEMLTELGHHVTAAENGPAALALLSAAQGEFDLLLADFAMPVMNGAQVATEALKLQPRIAILFITGYGDIPTSVRAMKAGAIDFLIKPFDDVQFLAAIEEAVPAEKANPEPAKPDPAKERAARESAYQDYFRKN